MQSYLKATVAILCMAIVRGNINESVDVVNLVVSFQSLRNTKTEQEKSGLFNFI